MDGQPLIQPPLQLLHLSISATKTTKSALDALLVIVISATPLSMALQYQHLLVSVMLQLLLLWIILSFSRNARLISLQ